MEVQVNAIYIDMFLFHHPIKSVLEGELLFSSSCNPWVLSRVKKWLYKLEATEKDVSP